MRVAVASAHMDMVSGASQLAITLCDALEKLGHEAFIVTRANGYFGMRYCVGRVKLYTPMEFMHIPKPDAAIVCHARQFAEMRDIKQSVFYVMGWSHLDVPHPEVKEYVCVSEELEQYLRFVGVKKTQVINCAVDLPRIKLGPALRRTKPKVLIATTKTIPRQEWYKRCEKLGWEPYDPPGAYPIPNLHEHYPEVDIVIGTETVILEALAANRAAFVAGPWGYDGWVTPDNIVDITRHSQSGRFNSNPLQLMEVELEKYDPAMGDYGRDLCEKHFNPIDKASELLEVACA